MEKSRSLVIYMLRVKCSTGWTFLLQQVSPSAAVVSLGLLRAESPDLSCGSAGITFSLEPQISWPWSAATARWRSEKEEDNR